MKKNKKGFTLIELLAVIVILGILVLVAVPAVSAYITNSRKSAYVNTAKAIMKGTMNLANDGSLDLSDTDTTYFIPSTCVEVDNNRTSPYGEFVKAYTAVGFDGESFSYYWISVDETGMGVSSLVSLDKIDTNNIVGDINPDDVSTDFGIGRKTKVVTYNSDCSSREASVVKIVINFKAGEGGVFPNGETTNKINAAVVVDGEKVTVTKHSHTKNISDDGTANGSYDIKVNNENITGTDRGDTSKSHVVSIPGAESLHVRITYGSPNSSDDFVCIWKGSHPNYVASNNFGNSITGKLGGWKTTKEYDVEGDTVTFGFGATTTWQSDQRYGYYAVVTADVGDTYTGTYLEPSKDNANFAGWRNDETGDICSSFACVLSSTGTNFTAVYEGYGTLNVTVPFAVRMKFNNHNVSYQTVAFEGKAGDVVSFGEFYSNGASTGGSSFKVSFDSDGGTPTPANKSATRSRSISYTFNRLEFVGDCGAHTINEDHSGTYTFPNTPGSVCNATLYVDEHYGEFRIGSITLPAAPTKEGYTFAGWKSSADNQIYGAGESYTPTENNIVMTAQWT